MIGGAGVRILLNSGSKPHFCPVTPFSPSFLLSSNCLPRLILYLEPDISGVRRTCIPLEPVAHLPLDLLCAETMPKGKVSKTTTNRKGGFKLTARKTTGGSATRVPLDGRLEQDVTPQPSEAPTALIHPLPTQPIPECSADSLPVVLRGRGEGGGSFNSKTSDLVSSATYHLGFRLIPIARQWCALCYDGGDILVECHKCGRMNCSVCIPGLAEVERDLQSLEYHCPPCHGRRQVFYVCYLLTNSGGPLTFIYMQGFWKGDKPLLPDGMKISDHAVSVHGSRLNGRSLAIVELLLDTLPDQGTPAQVLFTNLQACYTSNPGDLKHFRCVIKIKSGDLEPHQRAMRKIAIQLNRWVLPGNFSP